jgi:hypothetical protein
MKSQLSQFAIRWAIIGGIALSTPWIVSRGKSATAPSEGAASSIFRIGEILNYRIDWQRYAGAGIAQLQVMDRGDFHGAPAWHFRASVHTVQPIRALYSMDDQIDSYALFAGLVSRQYQERFREFGKPEDTDANFVFPGEVSDVPAPHVIVPQGTHDALSAIYLLRATDWRSIRELRAPVFDGQDVYEMIAKPDAPAALHISMGTYEATEVEIRLLDSGKEIPDERFKVWIADDAARTPLLCEADLSFGTLRIELTSDSASEPKAAGSATIPPARSNHQAGN